MPFTKWPDIESLHNVVRGMKKYKDVNPDYKFPIVTYRGKVKLDGTNAAVRLTRPGLDGLANVTAQSRSQDISVANDNCGFARFVHERHDQWLALVKDLFEDNPTLDEYVIYGEWAGKGIQKGTSVSTIDGKYFCVFAIQGVWAGDEGKDFLLVDSEMFASTFFFDLPLIEGVRYLGWEGPTLTVDFGDETALRKFSETVESEVLRIEGCDPWTKSTFGAEGVGEGLVYYPTVVNGREVYAREEIERLMFKAKGEKHRVKKAEKAAPVNVESLASVQEFVDTFVTGPRLEQGVTFVGGVDVKKMGDFLKWFCQDVEKESKAELETSDLTWKQVAQPVQKTARDWYLAQTKKL